MRDPDPKKLQAHVDLLPVWGEGWHQDSSSIDGLVPSCRVSSWQHFMEVMREDEFKKVSRELVFRGQRGCHWPLASTLGRKFDSGSIPPKNRAALLNQFELAMRGRGYDLSLLSNEVEKWAIGQHHGLCTPLLDWTRSPFVALFFAFNRKDGGLSANPSRAVFCLNRSALANVFEDEEGLFIEPRNHDNARLVNQAGLFTLTPSGEDNIAAYIVNKLINDEVVIPEVQTSSVDGNSGSESGQEYQVEDNLAAQLSQYLFKIHIPNDDRLDCLEMLRKMNIHNGSLFPDAVGASLFCNDWLDRVLIEEQEAQRILDEAVAHISGPAEIDVEAAQGAWQASGDVVTGLAPILTAAFSGHDKFLSDLTSLANKIDARFRATRSIDWPRSEAKKARIRTGFRRLLLSLEVPSDVVDRLTDSLISFYEKETDE